MSNLDYEINKELGECYLFMGELDKAEEYYRKAASSNGIHPDPYLGLATIAVQRGELDGAMSMYRKAHGIEPSDKTFSGIGLIQMESGDLPGAFQSFDQALAINPENMVALFSMVRLGHELEKLESIAPHLENYLAIDPGKHEVRYALAGCYVCMNRKDDAARELSAILENHPDNGPAQELLTQIQD
ncbi:MAG: tetratricopeptide repeat protein [Proteobacteria bacterium]|nr:tetratricopeptide repeat protein [Pseudomonadota bacterium]MBU1612499.1 tetratricopeptide repeat protein [Pseudomonadota bacterium]